MVLSPGLKGRIATRGQGGQGNQDIQGAIGQETVTGESWVDVSVHGFWKCRTSALFDMQIVNLYMVPYLRQTSAKALALAEKEKMEKFLQPCL